MLKEIHVLNSIYVVDKLMTLVKPFMSKELLNLVMKGTGGRLEGFMDGSR